MSDQDRDNASQNELLRLTAEVVSAFVRNNALPAAQVSEVIQTVFNALVELGNQESSRREGLRPAVPVNKSIAPDYIVCLEDGKKLKMLKRHLRTTYKLTPEQYRQKWGLPADYPMVAPNYAQQRSAFAKKIGLGRKPGEGGRRGRKKAK